MVQAFGKRLHCQEMLVVVGIRGNILLLNPCSILPELVLKVKRNTISKLEEDSCHVGMVYY